ncbi:MULTISPECIES: hypothetical protein [unclassified Rhodococcus (in: high G+C Gram-positive bacteria)]|uniref:hypothetical protein n=1 Tax=unclassified Rhodococcus (in: high G+C Gram-positive bacteria) TaxID=192944 RepID=UPI00163A6CF6|nr:MULTISPECIES: hypothetical protein [unclassified Rhodococcus (in: high G+C Gram-positive bacteria)]MBC2644183.1 hypothetical protein [Rhodococcus sp. 3A]MBC2891078.1 hypothetical protein [Rhodococcus sp. 4CII]
MIKSDVLPYTAPFHLDSRIGVHLSWTPTLGRWWRILAEGWHTTMPIRLHSEVVAGTRDTYITQGGTPVAVEVVAELAGVRVATHVALPLPASRRIEVSGALNVSKPADRTDGRRIRSRVLPTTGRVGRIRMLCVAVGVPADAPDGWVASQYLPGTVREYELRRSPAGVYTYPTAEGDDGDYREELLVVDLMCDG